MTFDIHKRIWRGQSRRTWLRRVSAILIVAFLDSMLPDSVFVRAARASCAVPGNASSESLRVTEFAYDAEGRVAQVNAPEGVVNYEYAAAMGRHTATCTANSRTEYGYDELGRLATVKVTQRDGRELSTPEITTIQYTGVGGRAMVTLPNGVATEYRYDALNRLTNLTHQAGGQVLAAYDYSLHPTGRRLGAVETRRESNNTLSTTTISWGYDGLYRLTSETSTQPSAVSRQDTYTYDKVGNPVAKTTVGGSGSVTTAYSYNANDQLTTETQSSQGIGYGYDANGSLTNKSAATAHASYRYDTRNRLSGAVLTDNSGTHVTSYRYNDQGIRVRATYDAGTNVFLVDGNNPTGYAQVLEELPERGATPRVSYTLGANVTGQSAGGVVSYLLPDGHGSTRLLASATGAILARYDYDAYGEVLGSGYSVGSPPATKLLYADEQYDLALQQTYLRARYYEPAGGRFGQVDAFGGSIADPQSLNKYEYAHDDPIGRCDPTGLAVYFATRKLGFTLGPVPVGSMIWLDGTFAHGYLLFTSTSDPGSADPLASGQPVTDSFSWHPYIWGYTTEEARNPLLPGVPGRVWERHPDDTMPQLRGIPYQTLLVTANPAQQTMFQSFIHNWIAANHVGYDSGWPIQVTDPYGNANDIGSAAHISAPKEGVYYSLFEQNCVWWAAIMLKQSGISVPQHVYNAIARVNMGQGAASRVINGQRSAYQVNRVYDPTAYLREIDARIEALAFMAAYFGIL